MQNMNSNHNQKMKTISMNKASLAELIENLNIQIKNIEDSLMSSKTIDCTVEIKKAYGTLEIAKKRRGREDEKNEIDFVLSNLNLKNCFPEIR